MHVKPSCFKVSCFELKKVILAFSDSVQHDDEDKPVLVIEPQVISLANLKKEQQLEELASNAGSPDVKLNTDFSSNCKYLNEEKCSSFFKEEELLSLRMRHLELDNTALDLVILAQIQSHLHCGEEAVKSKKASQTARKCHRLDEGQKICCDTFMYIHAVFKDRLAALVQHYLQNGVTPTMHGNKGKLPKHALDVNDIERVVTFIHNYAEENAVLLPGRIPGYKRDDLKLLPSSVSKVAIHKLYSDSCQASGHRAVSECTFYRLWQQYVPNVLPMKPMSDLCWTCQKNSALLVKASKKDFVEKTEAVAKAEEHLWQATTERSYYKSKVQECRESPS